MPENPLSESMLERATRHLTAEQKANILPTIITHAENAREKYGPGPHAFNETGVGLFLATTISDNRSYFIPAAAYFETAFGLARPDEVTSTVFAGNLINSVASYLDNGDTPISEMQWIVDMKESLKKAQTCIHGHAQKLITRHTQATNVLGFLDQI